MGGFPCTGGESLSNVIKGSSFGLRYSQEGEDEEEDEEDHKDDEDVRTTKFLRDEEIDVCKCMSNFFFIFRFRSSKWDLTSNLGKPSPTRKLAVQLEKPEMAMAAGRGPWEKSSATINQGMGPGPISKLATKPNTATMAR